MKTMGAILATLLLSLTGCKGPQGDQGPMGLTGASGPGVLFALQGNVLSDAFTVTDSRISPDVGVIVYVGDASGAYTPIPAFMPAVGLNIYCLIRVGKVEIYNAYSLYGKTYRVIVLTKTTPSGYGAIARRMF